MTDFLTAAVLAAAFGGPGRVQPALGTAVGPEVCTNRECCCYLTRPEPKPAATTTPDLPLFARSTP